MTRNMGYGEFSDFYFSRQPKYGHSKNALKYPPIGAILRGVLQQPPEGGWDQTKYGHGHTPWVLDQPWYQNSVTRFGHFSLGFEGLANEHLNVLFYRIFSDIFREINDVISTEFFRHFFVEVKL